MGSYVSDEELKAVYEASRQYPVHQQAADFLGISVSTYKYRLKTLLPDRARKGHLGFDIVLPGFEIAKTTEVQNEDGEVVRRFITQKPEAGEEFQVPEGHAIKGVSALVGADGRTVQQWVKTAADAEQREAAFRAVVEGLKADLPRAAPVAPPDATLPNLLTQYTYTDAHFGALAWHEECGEDYDLVEAERLLTGFIGAGVGMAPASDTAVFAQLGDFLHYDGLKSITPEHGNLLDTDTRFPKIVRSCIRVTRWTLARLLEKHSRVHVIMADANHDPASGVWLREMLAAFYDDEPRLTVDTSASTYYGYEFGYNALFYHHGHRTKAERVDKVFVRDFREMYGRARYAYAHVGHEHKDGLENTTLMKVERHETMAGKDAFAAHREWRSGRSAKVIHYHKDYGEVSRNIITPAMLAE